MCDDTFDDRFEQQKKYDPLIKKTINDIGGQIDDCVVENTTPSITLFRYHQYCLPYFLYSTIVVLLHRLDKVLFMPSFIPVMVETKYTNRIYGSYPFELNSWRACLIYDKISPIVVIFSNPAGIKACYFRDIVNHMTNIVVPANRFSKEEYIVISDYCNEHFSTICCEYKEVPKGSKTPFTNIPMSLDCLKPLKEFVTTCMISNNY